MGRPHIIECSASLLRSFGFDPPTGVDERYGTRPSLNIRIRLDVDQDGDQVDAGRADTQLP